MPRINLDLKDFGGVICSPDTEDIAVNAASASLNVDGDVGEGILKGIPTNGSALSLSGGDGADIRL